MTGTYVVDDVAKRRVDALGLALPATTNPVLFFR